MCQHPPRPPSPTALSVLTPGLAVGRLDGQRVLVVGIAISTIGDTYVQVWAQPA